MAEESKQFTAFTLGSMGLFECDRMPFGLCNAPVTFQRLMQNCLGELNLTYSLIYLDDVIVYSKTPEEHLQRMHIIFDCLREHGLKLKPTKCDLFRTELLSDKGKSFTTTVVEDLCKLYSVKKLRTSSYHTQTNGQVEHMNQTLIHLIGKLDEDKKACWSKHLPELLMAYNSTHSAVTGYSPHFLLFGRRPRIPVDYLFPTLRDMPHKSKLEESVALHQKRLKEAFAMARQLTSEEAARQQCHYDRRAGAITLQPGDVVMVCTDRFVGERKVKDRWEEGGYVIVNQLEDWPVYKVKCPPSENKCKAKCLTLHHNCLMLVPPEDDTPQDPTQLKVVAAIVLNANIGTILYDGESDCSDSGTPLPSLLTRQGVDKISHVWLNGEFRTQLFTQIESKATESPQDSVENDVSDPEPVSTDLDEEET